MSHRVRRLETSWVRRCCGDTTPAFCRHPRAKHRRWFDKAAGRFRGPSFAVYGCGRTQPVTGRDRCCLGGQLARAASAGFCRVVPSDIGRTGRGWERGTGTTAHLDIRILWVPASELKATSCQSPLFQERVFPVCNPSILPSGFALGDASILTKLPLLHKGPAGRGTTPNGRGRHGWNDWACPRGRKRAFVSLRSGRRSLRHMKEPALSWPDRCWFMMLWRKGGLSAFSLQVKTCHPARPISPLAFHASQRRTGQSLHIMADQKNAGNGHRLRTGYRTSVRLIVFRDHAVAVSARPTASRTAFMVWCNIFRGRVDAIGVNSPYSGDRVANRRPARCCAVRMTIRHSRWRQNILRDSVQIDVPQISRDHERAGITPQQWSEADTADRHTGADDLLFVELDHDSGGRP